MSAVPPSMDKKTRVLVLGAGFAGLECCKTLTDQRFDVTLIDRQNHHLFQPLLYQVATASLTAPDIAQPIREILATQDNVRVLMDEVTAVDLDKQEVLSREQCYCYDYLVIALGAKTGYFGNPDWEMLAQSFGWHGHYVSNAADLAGELEDAFKEDGPSLVVIPIDYRENALLTKKLGEIQCAI